MSEMEFTPPKYAQIVNAIRGRISDGTYPPGSMLPSETQLVREFATSRTTVVRALQMLRLQGWIDREHGRGSFVKARPSAETQRSRSGREVLESIEASESRKLLEVSRAPLPVQVAGMLDVPEKSPALLRQHLVEHDGEPSELVSVWFPTDVAEGTDLDSATPLPTGAPAHLHALKGVRFDHVTERVGARLPSEDEAKLLTMDSRLPVLTMLVVGYDANGRALEVVDLVLPADRHEFASTAPMTE